MTENEIREMMKDMCGELYGYEGENNRNLYRYAKNLANANYRKVPDGAVVLSKEEYEKLNNRSILVAEIGLIDELKSIIDKEMERLEKNIEIDVDKIRKETAREIFQRLYDRMYEDDYELHVKRGGYRHLSPVGILQIAKEYGVEVEE